MKQNKPELYELQRSNMFAERSKAFWSRITEDAPAELRLLAARNHSSVIVDRDTAQSMLSWCKRSPSWVDGMIRCERV